MINLIIINYQSLYYLTAINNMENTLLLDEHDEEKKTEDENNEANNGEDTNGDDVEDFVDEEWKRAKPATSLDQISEAIKHKKEITVFDGSKHLVQLTPSRQEKKEVKFQQEIEKVIIEDKKRDRAELIGAIAAAVAKYRLEGCGDKEVSIELRILPVSKAPIPHPSSSQVRAINKGNDGPLFPEVEEDSTPVKLNLKPPGFLQNIYI